VDLSIQAYVASFLEAALPYYTYSGLVASRLGARGLNPWRMLECRDGIIFVVTIEQDQWERLVELMGNPEWAALEIFADFPSRMENADALHMFLQEWAREWTVADLYREGQARRICFAPVFTMRDLGDHAHLQARGFFVDVTHPRAAKLVHPGPPYRLAEPWWRLRRPAPLLGEHDAEVAASLPPARPPAADPPPLSQTAPASGRPLEGIRIAEFTWVWAGPFCGLQLAHLGADMIKLESEGRPDLGRRLAIWPTDAEPGPNRSGYFNQWNQGKRSVRLNLAHPEAIAVAKRLVAECDVVLDNFATGVMERLGLGYEALRAVKPDLIVASISGYGETGPLQGYMGYGPAVAPLAGLSSLSGYPGGGPREVGISLGDPTAGITTAVAICAALVARERTGRGQRIDVSLWESTAALVAEGWMEFAMNGTEPPRIGNRDPWMSPHGCFRCAGEDAWVTITCACEEEWQALCGVIGDGLAADARFRTAADRKANEDTLEDRIRAWTEPRDRWEVVRTLQAAGVAAFPSMSPQDLAHDPHLEERGFLERLEHPEVGERTHAGVPWRLANAANGVRAPAPLLGEHTHEVLGELLGYSETEIDRLTREGVLY
jgi:crotonobetainyl-CoA:carnitine CoA-transferase CaiB-like acyl-CoA transferase